MDELISNLLELEYFEFKIAPIYHDDISYIIKILIDNNYAVTCIIEQFNRVLFYKNHIYNIDYFDSLYLKDKFDYEKNGMLYVGNKLYQLNDIIREYKLKELREICNI